MRPDQLTIDWLLERRSDLTEEEIRSAFVIPDPDAHYDGGVHTINLDEIRPMVAHPGNPDEGIPSDPTNGAYIDELGDVAIDIAYAALHRWKGR